MQERLGQRASPQLRKDCLKDDEDKWHRDDECEPGDRNESERIASRRTACLHVC